MCIRKKFGDLNLKLTIVSSSNVLVFKLVMTMIYFLQIMDAYLQLLIRKLDKEKQVDILRDLGNAVMKKFSSIQ